MLADNSFKCQFHNIGFKWYHQHACWWPNTRQKMTYKLDMFFFHVPVPLYHLYYGSNDVFQNGWQDNEELRNVMALWALTYWGLNKMGAIWQAIIPTECQFCQKKIVVFKIFIKFNPYCPICNRSALVQVVAWCWAGNEQITLMSDKLVMSYGDRDLGQHWIR